MCCTYITYESKFISESNSSRFLIWNEGVNNYIALFSYTKAFGDGPGNFEPWSSNVNDALVWQLLSYTTPREDVQALDRFNVHRYPTWRVFRGTGLVTSQLRSDTLTTRLPRPLSDLEAAKIESL
ncbi:hypothetical protein TNCV_3002291 [Trichonephila clavipes]|nr:hypothetical protein TNCV_3002291 [Trichonephila clavipes]